MDPVTTRGRATRARILESAARLIHLNGVAATSVDDVLAAAGAGKSQLYHYFPSKDELVRAVLDFQALAAEEEQAAIFAATPGWEGIRRWLDAVVDGRRRSGYRGGCPLGSLAAEAAERDPELRERLTDAFRRKQALLTRRLEELREQGALSLTGDPERLAGFTLATLQGGLLLASTLRDPRLMESAVEEAWGRLASLRIAP